MVRAQLTSTHGGVCRLRGKTAFVVMTADGVEIDALAGFETAVKGVRHKTNQIKFTGHEDILGSGSNGCLLFIPV